MYLSGEDSEDSRHGSSALQLRVDEDNLTIMEWFGAGLKRSVLATELKDLESFLKKCKAVSQISCIYLLIRLCKKLIDILDETGFRIRINSIIGLNNDTSD
jgi:hypothetical protein